MLASSAASSIRHYHKVGILLGLGLGLLMAGCTVTSTPETAVKSAVSTAQESRVGNAGEVMTGAALDAFGTKEGLAALQEKLNKVLSIAPPQLISSAQGDQGNGHYGDIKRVYVTNVSGLTKEGSPADYTVHITCDVNYEEEHTPAVQGPCRVVYDQDHPGGFQVCDQDTPAYDAEGEIPHCRVSDIVARGPSS